MTTIRLHDRAELAPRLRDRPQFRLLAVAGVMVCAGMFLWAGYTKILAPVAMQPVMLAFGVPLAFARHAAITLGVVEVAVAAGAILSLPNVQRWSWVLSSFLIAFSVALLLLFFWTDVPSCGCLGASVRASRGATFAEAFARNGLLLVLLVPALIVTRKRGEAA